MVSSLLIPKFNDLYLRIVKEMTGNLRINGIINGIFGLGILDYLGF